MAEENEEEGGKANKKGRRNTRGEHTSGLIYVTCWKTVST